MTGFRFSPFLAALASFIILLQPVLASAQENNWNEPPSDRGYIPDGGPDAPQNITPDAPRDYSPAARRYNPPPQSYERAPQTYERPRQDYGRQHQDQRNVTDNEYSSNEISRAGHEFFGSVSVGMAKVIEHAFKSKGRPNGYILGEEAGGAFIAGLRYGEGTLFTKDAGQRKVYWQGPSIGYDVGASGSKTMILVYNLYNPNDVYRTYGGVAGSAYFIGGVGITFLQRDHVSLAPIVSGIGLRFGANVGYLNFTRKPSWNPFF